MKYLFNTEPFVFQSQKFKIYLDLEMTFYSVNFDDILHRFIYKEDYNSLVDPDVSRFKTIEL